MNINNIKELALRNCDNDDSVSQILNLFTLLINSGDYEPSELPETKRLLDQAFIDYENVLRIARKNTNNNDKAEQIYQELIDKHRDNY